MRTAYRPLFAEMSDDGTQVLQTRADDGAVRRIVAARSNSIESLERRFSDIGEVRRLRRNRLAENAQDGPANRVHQLLGSGDRPRRRIVCQELQPPSAVIKNRQIFGARNSERTRRSRRRPKGAVREREAVALRGLHEELLLGGSRLRDQRTECVAESIELLRVMLIHADDIPAEMRSSRSLGPTGILAETNTQALKYPIDLP